MCESVSCRARARTAAALRDARCGEVMLDLLQPWVIKSTLVISALTLFNVVLYIACAWLERREYLETERLRATIERTY